MCPGEDLNLHVLADNSPSSYPGYQLQHPGVLLSSWRGLAQLKHYYAYKLDYIQLPRTKCPMSTDTTRLCKISFMPATSVRTSLRSRLVARTAVSLSMS